MYRAAANLLRWACLIAIAIPPAAMAGGDDAAAGALITRAVKEGEKIYERLFPLGCNTNDLKGRDWTWRCTIRTRGALLGKAHSFVLTRLARGGATLEHAYTHGDISDLVADRIKRDPNASEDDLAAAVTVTRHVLRDRGAVERSAKALEHLRVPLVVKENCLVLHAPQYAVACCDNSNRRITFEWAGVCEGDAGAADMQRWVEGLLAMADADEKASKRP